MKNFFKIMLAFAATALIATGCTKKTETDSTEKPNSVITLSTQSVSLNATAGSGAKITVTVPRFGWSASCDQTWVTLTPASSTTLGSSDLVITATANSLDVHRTATVTVQSGNVKKNIAVTQLTSSETGEVVYKHPDATANVWMYQTLCEWYLWNDLVKAAYPDYEVAYSSFLDNTLLPLKGNELDGGTNSDGERYIYSYVEREATSRAGGDYASFGIGRVLMMGLTTTQYVARVLYVTPGSPAAKAGISRGEYIETVNGSQITPSNYVSQWYNIVQPKAGSTTLGMITINTDANGKFTGSSSGRKLTLSTANIGNDPVLLSKVLDYGGHKVGYLAYTSFTRGKSDYSTEYDQEMENAFKAFKTAGIDNLVIDLRYNGGGAVSSCQKMSTMIAPASKISAYWCRFRYNADIEKQATDDDKKLYLLGSSYSDKNVNMSTIYVLCSDNTASASEMIVSGMRGLDVKVVLIGTKTEGKNVGMNVQQKTIGDYDYTFAPISFQIYNAKEFSDYASGFTPDYTIDEWDQIGSSSWYELGNEHEILLAKALSLISGNASASVQTRAATGRQFKTINVRDNRIRNNGALIFPGDKFSDR